MLIPVGISTFISNLDTAFGCFKDKYLFFQHCKTFFHDQFKNIINLYESVGGNIAVMLLPRLVLSVVHSKGHISVVVNSLFSVSPIV